MKTPVIIPAQAFEMSKLIARRAPSASLSDRLKRRLELHPQAADVVGDARHDQHVEVLRSTVRVRQGVARRAERERVGVLALAGDTALADARQPLEIDAGRVRRARHELIAAQPPLGDRGADADETARVGPTARVSRRRRPPTPSSARRRLPAS